MDKTYKRGKSGSRASKPAKKQQARASTSRINVATRGLQLTEGEFKAVDVAATTAINSATAVALLNGIAPGSDIDERVGREVMMKSIQFKAVTYATPATGEDQLHRVLIVYDRQTNATALTAAEVLSTANVLAPRNLENRKRFSILFDRTYTINDSDEPGTFRTIKFYRHLKHPITFNAGVAGTVADITTGSVYLVMIGSNAAGDTAGSIQYSSRIRYLDH